MTVHEMIEELLDRGNLTKWESSFLISLSDKVDRGHILSGYEQEKLREIHDERV